jgi:hypothetical protein
VGREISERLKGAGAVGKTAPRQVSQQSEKPQPRKEKAMTIIYGFNKNGNNLISGRGLAHRKLTPRKRRELAVGVVNGVYQYQPTQAEIAASFKVPPAELSREKARNGNGHATDIKAFVQAWHTWSDSERDALVKALGVGSVWDSIARVIS